MIRRKIILLLLLTCFTQTLIAQYSEYEVKAAYINSIVKFVEWPTVNSTLENSQFIISIVGTNPFKNYLEEIARKTNVYNKSVKINYIDSQQIPKSNIVFICNSEKQNLQEILDKLNDEETLIISDTKGFAEKGVHLHFYSYNNNIRFEINLESVKETKLKISSRLLKLSRIIH